MENRISKIKDHFVICGYGRVGKEVAAVFSENKVPFVVIDPSDAASADATEAGYLFLQGDASSDEVLKKAEIGRSRGLVAATGNDAQNVFITLSAKALCPGLFVVARTYSEEAVAKLERAGADRVVAPLRQGGRRMAMLALRPLAVDFVDAVLGRAPSSLELEHIKIVGSSPLASKKVGEGEKLTGVTILVLRKKEWQCPSETGCGNAYRNRRRPFRHGSKKTTGKGGRGRIERGWPGESPPGLMHLIQSAQ